MSDGAASDPSAILGQLMFRHAAKNLTLHTVGFGAGASHGLLSAMAKQGKGQFHKALDGAQLQTAFTAIASSANVLGTLVSEFGDRVSSMISHRIVEDHL